MENSQLEIVIETSATDMRLWPQAVHAAVDEQRSINIPESWLGRSARIRITVEVVDGED